MSKYERVHQVDHALSIYAITYALGKCGFTAPTLYVHPDQAWAFEFQKEMRINVVADDELQDAEWYVEWGGKRFGSIGC